MNGENINSKNHEKCLKREILKLLSDEKDIETLEFIYKILSSASEKK